MRKLQVQARQPGAVEAGALVRARRRSGGSQANCRCSDSININRPGRKLGAASPGSSTPRCVSRANSQPSPMPVPNRRRLPQTARASVRVSHSLTDQRGAGPSRAGANAECRRGRAPSAAAVREKRSQVPRAGECTTWCGTRSTPAELRGGRSAYLRTAWDDTACIEPWSGTGAGARDSVGARLGSLCKGARRSSTEAALTGRTCATCQTSARTPQGGRRPSGRRVGGSSACGWSCWKAKTHHQGACRLADCPTITDCPTATGLSLLCPPEARALGRPPWQWNMPQVLRCNCSTHPPGCSAQKARLVCSGACGGVAAGAACTVSPTLSSVERSSCLAAGASAADSASMPRLSDVRPGAGPHCRAASDAPGCSSTHDASTPGRTALEAAPRRPWRAHSTSTTPQGSRPTRSHMEARRQQEWNPTTGDTSHRGCCCACRCSLKHLQPRETWRGARDCCT